MTISVILGSMNVLILSLFDNAFMEWMKIVLGDTVYPERIISYLILRNFSKIIQVLLRY